MSLYESGQADGQVSLGALLDGAPVHAYESAITLPSLAQLIAVGGWPGLLGMDTEPALRRVRDYLDEIRRTDIEQVDGVSRDPDKVMRLLQSLARNIATEARLSTLIADTAGRDKEPISENTVASYLSALERLMIVEDQPAWAPHLRAKARLRQTAKRHFVDPSLAVAALRADGERILNDLRFLGFLFESLVVRDLRVYAQANDAEVFHYRDNTGLEIDAVVQTASGSWHAFEIKLGGQAHLEEGAANLHRFAGKVDTSKSGPQAGLAIIVATGFGYKRKDGIHVVPIGALGP